MQSQKDAVVKSVMSVVEEYTLNQESPLSEVITKDQKDRVKAILFNGFRNGDIELSTEAAAKYRADAELKKYVSGLLDNWIRKYPGFNAGQSYVTKNPGSRSGSGDAQVKALKALLKTVTDNEVRAQVEQAINDRLAEIKPETKITIDVEALPENLRHLVK
jgi:hypothetical protein